MNPNARLMKLAMVHGNGRKLKRDKLETLQNSSGNNNRNINSADSLTESANNQDKRLTGAEAALSLQLSTVIKSDNNPKDEAIHLMFVLRVKEKESKSTRFFPLYY